LPIHLYSSHWRSETDGDIAMTISAHQSAVILLHRAEI